MAEAEHLNKYLHFVNLWNGKNCFSDIDHLALSPRLDYMCVVTLQREAALYSLPSNEIATCPQPMWQSSSKVHRCIFSEDGTNVLVILKVNSFQIYSLKKETVCPSTQIKASELTHLFQAHDIDFSAGTDVKPLRLKKWDMTLMLDQKILIKIEWGITDPPSLSYSISVAFHKDIFMGEKYVIVLNNAGFIISPYKHRCQYNMDIIEQILQTLTGNPDMYNVFNGELCFNELYKFADGSGDRLLKITAHSADSAFVAAANEVQEVVLLDFSDCLGQSEREDAYKCSSGRKKEKWTWPYNVAKLRTPTKAPATVTILGRTAPPPTQVVSHLQFSIAGLFVFYCVSGQSKSSSFKVVDESSGEVLYSFDGLVESKVVSGGPLPLVMTDSILSVCLGILCNDHFVVKLCEVALAFRLSKDVERTLMCLSSGKLTASCHLIFLKVVLGWHKNVFRKSLEALSLKRAESIEIDQGVDVSLFERKILESANELFRVVAACREEKANVESDVKDPMLLACLFHFLCLLDVTQVERTQVSNTDLFSGLLEQVLTLFEWVGGSEPLRNDWIAWLEMNDDEIVRDAVSVGAVGLAHVFLVTQRGWPAKEVEADFKSKARAWIAELIIMNDLDKAKIALRNLGCDPVKRFKHLCLSTNDQMLRDVLFNHLSAHGQCSEQEKKAWNFCKEMESALSCNVRRHHVFEQKMSVSAGKQIRATACKLSPYSGSINLTTLLNCAPGWCDNVATEIYFHTGDMTLEKYLGKHACWEYLLKTNKVDLLKNWICIGGHNVDATSSLKDSSGSLTRTFRGLFAGWSVTQDMLDAVSHAKTTSFAGTLALDLSAFCGLFSTRDKHSLRGIVSRLENVSSLSATRVILSKATSNVTLTHFYETVLAKCLDCGLKAVALTCLEDVPPPASSLSLGKADDGLWIDVWSSFKTWAENENVEKIALKDAIVGSSLIHQCDPDESSMIEAAVTLLEEREISDAVERKGSQCSLLRLPLVKVNLETPQGGFDRATDVTVYALLRGSKTPVDRLFLWQVQNKNAGPLSSDEVFSEFPHFNHQVLGVKFGFKQCMDPMYYLKQGRPSFACNLFVVESLRAQRRLTTKMIKRVCGTVHGVALRLWNDASVGNACVTFVAMLGDIADANVLRVHLGSIERVSHFLHETDRFYLSTLARGIGTNDLLHVQEVAFFLEQSVMSNAAAKEAAASLENWYLPVSFCNIHSLPLPSFLLKHLARGHQWFSFVTCMDIFKYPYDQAIDLVEEIESKVLKSHLIRALTRTTLKLSTTSPRKSPPKILLEPENTGNDVDDTGGTAKDAPAKDVFQSFVTNIYTEVLNTIQTFTDRNIVLPWSCEQDPDSDVLLTLLKCESEPDTSKSLLISAIELQSPALSILATCFQSDNPFPNLIAWLVASIPTSMCRMRRRDEGQQLVDRLWGSKELETLLVNFFSTGYFQTFFRGMNLFLGENPVTLFLNAVYHGVVLLDFESAAELLKSFTVELAHYPVKESNPIFSRSWILSVVAQFIGNLLTRSDLQNSIKRRFLQSLALSDLSSADASFPNYLLWSQVCEILECSETNLNFIRLYDIGMVSEELQSCLDVLVKNFQFSQVLEICSILSLNRDRFVIAMWRHQLNIPAETDRDVGKILKDSSLAFKDENVNPTLAASFYYEVASSLTVSSSVGLRSRFSALEHCLTWRRIIEDTLSPSFKEESDAIELEKWKCCIHPNFELDHLMNADPVDTSQSLLLGCGTSCSGTKVFVRSPALEDSEKDRVQHLINTFLDLGDLQRALRLAAFFKSDNRNLTVLMSCLRMIHHKVSPFDAYKPDAVSSAAPEKLWAQCQHGRGEDSSECEVAPSKRQHQMLFVLTKLSQVLAHGKSLMDKILVCYRLSINLELTFEEIAVQRDPLSLLPRSVSLDGVKKFPVARDLIALANLSAQDLAKFLRDKIVAAVMECHSTDLVVPVTLWDVPLDSDFHSIINLIENPSMLGSELLQASTNLPCGHAIEILVRAHDCFTSACNVEGIGGVLRRARILASLALQAGKWNYLVRLLVGIGRYSDMTYIFQMLKDNGQFEQLLRKGMHKVRGLHVAISEFLQRQCPQDRELSKMVAAHFCLHSKLASCWQDEADEIVSNLPVVGNTLKDTSKTRQALALAVENYSHAAHWFVQAGKLKRALKVAHQAQMVAVQASLLGGPFVLGRRSSSDLQTLISGSLSVSQCLLVSRAHNFEPDWTAALHERWVLKGDKSFYADLKATSVFSPQLVHMYSVKYASEGASTGKARDRAKQLMTCFSRTTSPLAVDLRRSP